VIVIQNTMYDLGESLPTKYYIQPMGRHTLQNTYYNLRAVTPYNTLHKMDVGCVNSYYALEMKIHNIRQEHTHIIYC